LKKIIIGLCIVITGFILFIAQNEFKGNDTVNSIEEMFSSENFDVAQARFTAHSMGLSEKVLTVRIEKTQYKEQAKEYFRDNLDSLGMESYEIEVVHVDSITGALVEEMD